MTRPRLTRIVAVADVHGNLPALEAVMTDVDRRSVDAVINLGDHVSGPLWPRETLALLMRQSWVQIAGNHDRQLVHVSRHDHGPSDHFAFEQLTAEQLGWLATLRPTARLFEEVLACHGTPSDDTAYLLEHVRHGRADLAPRDLIARRLDRAAEGVVLCGHSHVPRVVRIGSALIVNPGSVGLPAFEHDAPDPHVVETGAADARYAILERSDDAWRVNLVTVAYDHAAAAERAERNGRGDWATALRHGRMAS
jgi:predicted phosphodiesterase